MSPFEILLIGMLFLFLLGTVGGISSYLESKKSIKKLRKEGVKNLRVHDEQAELFCCICNKLIDVKQGDIFYQGKWFCLPHWEESTSLDSDLDFKKDKL